VCEGAGVEVEMPDVSVRCREKGGSTYSVVDWAESWMTSAAAFESWGCTRGHMSGCGQVHAG
jgi:hypothetical protein